MSSFRLREWGQQCDCGSGHNDVIQAEGVGTSRVFIQAEGVGTTLLECGVLESSVFTQTVGV